MRSPTILLLLSILALNWTLIHCVKSRGGFFDNPGKTLSDTVNDVGKVANHAGSVAASETHKAGEKLSNIDPHCTAACLGFWSCVTQETAQGATEGAATGAAVGGAITGTPHGAAVGGGVGAVVGGTAAGSKSVGKCDQQNCDCCQYVHSEVQKKEYCL